MLTSLTIRNYALIEELAAEFPPGLIILTGETGAGKSIIIDALGLILGERADTDVVRAGADRAVAEGVFRTGAHPELRDILTTAGIEAGEDLIVRREVSVRGPSRCFLNDTPVPLALLRRTGEHLVDLHGQHEHQSLLRTERHIGFLDEFAGLGTLRDSFRAARQVHRAAAGRLQELRAREAAVRERSDLLAFQHREIAGVDPAPGEDERIAAELRVLENAERLFAGVVSVLDALAGEDRAARDQLALCRTSLRELAALDPRLSDAAGECAGAEAVVSELVRTLRAYHASLEFAPDRPEALRARLAALQALKRKYGGTLEEVLASRDRLATDLALADGSGEELRRAAGEAARTAGECTRLAGELSVARRKSATRLDRAVTAELLRLGIAHPKFVTAIRQEDPDPAADGAAEPFRHRLNENGWDVVEFFLSTNLGEDPRPLVRTASGGEVSRIMLALKTVLAGAGPLPVLIFDEIDTGVSGASARTVGRSLRNLAREHQVIAITHLPQIAGLADAHFAVEKTERDGRAVTGLRRLTEEERVREVARLLSGAAVTDAGLRGARELMNTDKDT